MNELKTARTKVGRYPLQKTGSEERPEVYKSVDYLYEHPSGYVWLRTVQDIKGHSHMLTIEFIHKGYKHTQWQTRGVGYTDRDLRRLAKRFADQKGGTNG